MALAVSARAAALALLLVAGNAWSAPAPEGRPVGTETIVVAPDTVDESPAPEDNDAASDAPAAPSGLPTAIPVVEYDVGKLPEPVRKTRQAIIDAAATGDLEKLRAVIAQNRVVPDFGPEELADPIAFLKQQSGDDEGREILAILIEVLDAGYVHVDAGTPDDMYIWPYFARYPVDQLSPPQIVELFKLVYAGDYQDMLAYGLYTSFRVGIAPDGTWDYFLTD